MQQKNIYCRASSKKNWDGRRMPPLQEDKKIRQANPVDLLLPATSIVLPGRLDEIKHTMDFHVDIVKKIDTLLREHEKKIILEELVSAQRPTLFPEEPFIEMRAPLSKKTEASMFQLEKQPDSSICKQPTMPDEFKTEFFTIHNPSFKFVSTLDTTEDVLRIKKPEDNHVEIVDLGSIATEVDVIQKESTMLLHKNQIKREHADESSGSKKDSNLSQSKKIEAIETKKLGSEKCDSDTDKQQTEEESKKGKIYYVNSKNLQNEKKSEKYQKKHSYIPFDFEDRSQKIKLKEQKELEKQRIEEQKKKEKEQREREAEEKRLKSLEEKKAKREAKEKQKEEKKALLEKLKKEAKEKKIRSLEEKQAKLDKLKKEAEEKKIRSLEEKQAILEAKKKIVHYEFEEKKEDVFPKIDKVIEEPMFVNDDVIKVLLIIDDLLGELPENVIEKFAQSEDFELYKKVIVKYKHRGEL